MKIIDMRQKNEKMLEELEGIKDMYALNKFIEKMVVEIPLYDGEKMDLRGSESFLMKKLYANNYIIFRSDFDIICPRCGARTPTLIDVVQEYKNYPLFYTKDEGIIRREFGEPINVEFSDEHVAYVCPICGDEITKDEVLDVEVI